MAARWSRRALLQAAGCGRAPAQPLSIAPWTEDGAAAAFAAFDPAVRPVAIGSSELKGLGAHLQAPPWAIFPATPGGVPDEARTVLPGCLDSFASHGQQYGVPISLQP